MKLYFGNTATTITTILLAALLGFMGYTIWHRAEIRSWGLRILFLAVFGLVVCCFAAARDGLDKTVQYMIDGSCAPGIFSLTGIPAMAGYVGAAIIIISALLTVFMRSQRSREILFYILSCGVTIKIAVMEIARIVSMILRVQL